MSESSKFYTIYGDYFYTTIDFPVARAEVIAIDGVSMTGFMYDTNITTGVSHTVTLQLYNLAGSVVSGFGPKFGEISFIRYPPMYYSDFTSNWQTVVNFTNDFTMAPLTTGGTG